MKGRQFIECLGLYDRLHRTDLCPWRPGGPSDGLLDIESKWVARAVADMDSVYTSYTWLRRILFREKGGWVSYAENGARDNPWMESFWGRM